MPTKTTPFTPWTAERMSGIFFDYILSGRLNVSTLIKHRYSPLEAPEVYRRLSEDRSTAVGVIFDWSTLD
jgi:threonine dehydrogenase-like Zn-dependent dehydrogenase